MLMWRNADRNCDPAAVERLVRRSKAALRRAGRPYMNIGFVVGPFPTVFCSTGQTGHQVDIEFAMWGDSFEESICRFSDVVTLIEKAVEECERNG